jgi:hypothetical protein
MIPQRQSTASTEAVSRSIHSSSAGWNSTFEMCCSAADALAPQPGDLEHRLRAVAADEHAARRNQLGGHEPRVPRSGGELEHEVARLRCERVDHRRRHTDRPVVNPVGDLPPALGGVLPSLAAVDTELVGIERAH